MVWLVSRYGERGARPSRRLRGSIWLCGAVLAQRLCQHCIKAASGGLVAAVRAALATLTLRTVTIMGRVVINHRVIGLRRWRAVLIPPPDTNAPVKLGALLNFARCDCPGRIVALGVLALFHGDLIKPLVPVERTAHGRALNLPRAYTSASLTADQEPPHGSLRT